MPITYNEANDIWELTDATTQEKESLTKMAIQDILDFFGAEVANRIVASAQKKLEDTRGEVDEVDVPDGAFSTGQAGNA